MPKVYVIEDGSMNAFATGRDPEHASVAVTRGLMNKLDRASSKASWRTSCRTSATATRW